MRIATVFDVSKEAPHRFLSEDMIRSALRRVLPSDLFFQEKEEGSHFEEELSSLLPLVHWKQWGEEESPYFSIILLCASRPNVGKFFFDMVSRWLLPGKQLNVSFFFTADFTFSTRLGIYAFSEIVIGPFSGQDLEWVRGTLPLIESEICLGAASFYHAKRILEVKGLTADEKTSLVQEQIVSLLQRRPADFDYDIFSQMQHFLVMCREEFKAVRETRHMSRLITLFYLFRKELRSKLELQPHQRHFSLKLMQTRLHLPLGVKKVLGVVVGVNFLKENELFEKQHLIAALVRLLPGVMALEESFLIEKGREDKIQMIYLEVEKESEEEFSLKEMKELRSRLPEELNRHVQHLTRPLFMPRNEEEVMRNIVTLSQQLKYLKDIPQVVITFEEQSDQELSFTVVLVRIFYPGAPSIEQMFVQANAAASESFMKFVPDRVKKMGLVRKKYFKEATVFRVKFSSRPFLRGDHSVDLYKARQRVVAEVQKVMGEVRDFNGGMISKQVEAFAVLKELLGPHAQQHELLLETFFHSIFPVELRSVILPARLKTLFLMMLQVKETVLSKREEENLFLMIPLREPSLKQRVFYAMETLSLSFASLVKLQIQMPEMGYLGYICLCPSNEDEQFLASLRQHLTLAR